MLDRAKLVPVGWQHPAVKSYLEVKNQVVSSRLVAIEGLRLLTRAYQAGLHIESLFVCSELLRGEESSNLVQQVHSAGITCWRVSEKTLQRMVAWEGPDGLVALVQLPHFDWQALRLRSQNAVLVLDGLQNPGNIGSIIRCADGAGIDAVLMVNRRCRLTHPKVIHASIGAQFSFPVIEAETGEAITWLQRHSFRIVTTDVAAPLNYRVFDYRGRIAIVMGNEHSGISRSWQDARYASISIPMVGRSDSLNVGNAAVLVLYEMIYQQRTGSTFKF